MMRLLDRCLKRKNQDESMPLLQRDALRAHDEKKASDEVIVPIKPEPLFIRELQTINSTIDRHLEWKKRSNNKRTKVCHCLQFTLLLGLISSAIVTIKFAHEANLQKQPILDKYSDTLINNNTMTCLNLGKKYTDDDALQCSRTTKYFASNDTLKVCYDLQESLCGAFFSIGLALNLICFSKKLIEDRLITQNSVTWLLSDKQLRSLRELGLFVTTSEENHELQRIYSPENVKNRIDRLITFTEERTNHKLEGPSSIVAEYIGLPLSKDTVVENQFNQSLAAMILIGKFSGAKNPYQKMARQHLALLNGLEAVSEVEEVEADDDEAINNAPNQ